MGFGEAFRTAVYKEPVMVWSLMIYATGLTYATFIKPNLADPPSTNVPKAPPTLKEVMAGIHAKLQK